MIFTFQIKEEKEKQSKNNEHSIFGTGKTSVQFFFKSTSIIICSNKTQGKAKREPAIEVIPKEQTFFERTKELPSRFFR